MISQLEVFCKRVGKRDESPYVECLRYCIRRKRSQRAATLWGSSLKGNPKGKLFDKEKMEKVRAGPTASDSKPWPAAEQAGHISTCPSCHPPCECIHFFHLLFHLPVGTE